MKNGIDMCILDAVGSGDLEIGGAAPMSLGATGGEFYAPRNSFGCGAMNQVSCSSHVLRYVIWRFSLKWTHWKPQRSCYNSKEAQNLRMIRIVLVIPWVYHVSLVSWFQLFIHWRLAFGCLKWSFTFTLHWNGGWVYIPEIKHSYSYQELFSG